MYYVIRKGIIQLAVIISPDKLGKKQRIWLKSQKMSKMLISFCFQKVGEMVISQKQTCSKVEFPGK